MKLVVTYKDGSVAETEGDTQDIDFILAYVETVRDTVVDYKLYGNDILITHKRVAQDLMMETADRLWLAVDKKHGELANTVYWEDVLVLAKELTDRGLYISNRP